jgi:hypothetical protein
MISGQPSLSTPPSFVSGVAAYGSSFRMPRWAAAPVHPPGSRSAPAMGIGRRSHTTPTIVCGWTPYWAKRPVYSFASAWLFLLPLAHRRFTLDAFSHPSFSLSSASNSA